MNIYLSKIDEQFFIYENGSLVSLNQTIPIVNGIPRFVESDNYASAFGKQWNRFQKTQLDSSINFPLSEERLKRCLGENLWNNLNGKLILEAGCGAGRFTEILLKKGAIVVSVDLSDAVDSNQRNFPISDKHYVCQADLNSLPFKKDFFDIVICLGVIQHTRNSEEAIGSLYSHVKNNGSLVIDHYRRTLSFLTRLLPVYRFFFKFFAITDTLNFTENLVKLWFPIHRLLGRNIFLYAILSRFSPIVTYFHSYPSLSIQAQYDWSIMDTHDSLFDFYKRLKTVRGIRNTLEKLPGVSNIFVIKGGIGIEARCNKKEK
jgi:2-polyprenyl-3-methyl-5-hydroxy-6-metoxy-1,4-benzoquinol methylase